MNNNIKKQAEDFCKKCIEKGYELGTKHNKSIEQQIEEFLEPFTDNEKDIGYKIISFYDIKTLSKGELMGYGIKRIWNKTTHKTEYNVEYLKLRFQIIRRNTIHTSEQELF